MVEGLLLRAVVAVELKEVRVGAVKDVPAFDFETRTYVRSYFMNRTIVVAGIAGALVLVGLVASMYYYYEYTVRTESEAGQARFKADYDAFEVPHHAGDVNASIPLARQLLNDAPTLAWEAQTKLLLAYDLFVRNNGEDRKEAYVVYKSVVADEDVPPRLRALALADMTYNIQMSSDKTLATALLFNDPPYSEVLAQANGDVSVALRRMYEWSDSVYPNAFAKIQVALIDGQQLVNNKAVPGLMREETAELIQRNIQDADPLLNAVRYEKGRLAQLYLSRAVALWMSSRVLQNVSEGDLKIAFDTAFRVANEGGGVHGKLTANTARLFSIITVYAGAGQDKEYELRESLKAWAADISSDASPAQGLTLAHLGSVAKRPPDDFIRKQIVGLAGFSSEFKALLQKSGWTF